MSSSNLLHNASMARLSMKLASAKEDILQPLNIGGGGTDGFAIPLERLEESGLGPAERRCVRRWYEGSMSGRACLFALQALHADQEAAKGRISSGGDHKHLFSIVNDGSPAAASTESSCSSSSSSSSSSSASSTTEGDEGVALLCATLSLPPRFLHGDGSYLYSACFKLAPAAALRRVVGLLHPLTSAKLAAPAQAVCFSP